MNPPRSTEPIDVTVVVPTYNRCEMLGPLLASLAAQRAPGVSFEVLVVDNNSTDRSREVVEGFAGRHPGLCLRYLFEPRQGVSYARNTGIAHARAPIIAFIDDDVEAAADWLLQLARAFEAHPEIHAIGGRVRPRWERPAPSWLTSRHHGAVAVQDRPAPMLVNAASASACLISANLACRAAACLAVGGFSPRYPRCQDREFQMRLWKAGFQGLYLPHIEVSVDVPDDRLTKRYHRRWQRTTGKYHARMRYRDLIDQTGALVERRHRTFLGTPLFMWRECLDHARGFLAALAPGRSTARFEHEAWLWYYAAYVVYRATAAEEAEQAPALEAALTR